MEQFFNKIFNKKKIEKVGQAGRTALVAGMVGVAASEGISANTETNMGAATNAEKMNINYENPARPEMATISKDAFSFEETEKKESLTGGDPEGESEFGTKEGVPITLTSAYFKTGTVEYRNAEAREHAKNDIREFLKTVNLSNSKIIVTGYSSKERPTDLNLTLAQKRTEEGVVLVKEVVAEDYPGQDIQIEFVVASDASVYDGLTEEEIAEIEEIKESSPEEFQKLINRKEAIGIDAVTMTPPPPPVLEEEIPWDQYGVIFVDESPSMQEDRALTLEKVKEIKEKTGKNIKVLTIEGGSEEAHLRSLDRFLDSYNGPALKILVITDEYDNSLLVKAYKEKIGDVIGKANNKGIDINVEVINPENKNESKIFDLKKHRNLLNGYDKYGKQMSFKDWYSNLK